MDSICSGHMLKVGSYQSHKVTKGINKLKINQSGPWTNAEVKKWEGEGKGIFLQQSLGAGRNRE